MTIRQAIRGLLGAAAVTALWCLPTARSFADDPLQEANANVWAFTVLDYSAVSSGHPIDELWFPTRKACEAARQAVVDVAEEQRPIPVVGRCRNTERPPSRPSS